MRTISAASLLKLSQDTGTEPIIIVEIEWTTGVKTTYCDRTFPGIDGRIQSIGSLEDGLNFSKSNTSQSTTLVLNDTDGQMKYIFDHVDIHRKNVWIYQWFEGIPITDKFLIFRGVITSPIRWSEVERTLSFDIVTKLDFFEIGFSFEEGLWAFLPPALQGRALPLVFGSPRKVPAILVDDIPHGSKSSNAQKRGQAADSITKDALGIADPSIVFQVRKMASEITVAGEFAQAAFVSYLLASATARKNGELGELETINKGKGTFSGLAKQYLASGNKYLQQVQQLTLKINKLNATLNKQKVHEKKSIGITNGSNFKQGVPVTINIGGAKHTGFFGGDNFNITDRTHPNAQLYSGMTVHETADPTTNPTIWRDNFFYVDSGTPVYLAERIITSEGVLSNTAIDGRIRYIISGTIQVGVQVVYAYRTINGIKGIYAVPGNLFTVIQDHFGTLPATLLIFYQALSSLTNGDGSNQGWEDDIFTDLTSTVGPNTVDIIQWIIEKYTDFTIDTVSFNSVRAQVASYPMHFCMFDRPSANQFIQDLAYQARCFIYSKDNVFYIKYLSSQDTAVDTITESDVIFGSLGIETTETEDIITKYVAKWVPDYLTGGIRPIQSIVGAQNVVYYSTPDYGGTSEGKKFEVILRYNTMAYGLFQKDFDYYAYNIQDLVTKSAVFWTIRTSSIFKRVICKLKLSKLNIEVMDSITINFSSIGPVLGIVEKAAYDPNDNTINLEVWTPIRLGETAAYSFAWPSDLSIYDFWPTEADKQQGRTETSLAPENQNVRESTNVTSGGQLTGDTGNGGTLNLGYRGLPNYTLSDISDSVPDLVSRIDSTQLQPVGTGIKPPGTTEYQFDVTEVKEVVVDQPGTITLPGKIVDVSPDDDGTHILYEVNIYFQGINNTPTLVKNVRQLQIDSTDQIDIDADVMVSRYVYNNPDTDETEIDYYIQAPVWG